MIIVDFVFYGKFGWTILSPVGVCPGTVHEENGQFPMKKLSPPLSYNKHYLPLMCCY